MEMAFEIAQVGRHHVQLWLHTEVNPTAERWDAAIALISAHTAAHPGAPLPGVVFTDGGAPNAAQRKTLQAVGKNRLSVMTTKLQNPVLRGIVTAIRWAYPAIAFFDPRDVKDALGHVGLGGDVDGVLDAMARLQQSVGPNRSFEAARAAWAAHAPALR